MSFIPNYFELTWLCKQIHCSEGLMMKLRYRAGEHSMWVEVVVSIFVAQHLVKEYQGYGWTAEIVEI
ncbi:hypothetical protein VAZ01S_009_00180 [Vibrio azureus NBRC 104587]|uniref:Uncharacterized protein n=1 Tax=Vibrio azureus NBRC 104587 TaxID=1219077 RepID=U3AKQ6_9VIBR|nr:hypothetical protein VAZ01S_009_00180 [Vibrio azureus NBRC 104587]